VQGWIKGSVVTTVGIAALWWAATRPLATVDAAPVSHATPAIVEDAAPAVGGVVEYARVSESASRTRNPFGYVEPEPEVVIAEAPVAPVVVVAAPPIVVAPPAEPPLPRFEHRYIGRFGPERDPIAAFSLNGDVITLRRGDRIGDRFVLRSVGLESVEVADGERIVRVAMGE
jgi:hypothetical protein